MAGTSTLRAQLVALLTGAAGTTKVMPAGRFVEAEPGKTLEQCAADAVERRVEVLVARGKPITALNGYDPGVLMEHAVTIRVGYLETDAGGGAPEGATPAGGSGIHEDIQDRAAADAHDITMVLTWGENFPTSGPAVFDVQRAAGEEDRLLEPDGQRVILEVPLLVRAEWDYQTPATYVP